MRATLRSFRTRQTLLFGGLSVVLSLVVVLLLEHVATAYVVRDRGNALRDLARAISVDLSGNIEERAREVTLLAQIPAMEQGDLEGKTLRLVLDRVRRTNKYYAWIGIAAPSGKVLNAADGLLAGADVSKRSWFLEGSKGPHVGDVHEALLLAKHLPPQEGFEPLRFIDFAAPIFGEDGALRGVLATHSHWSWVNAVVQAMLPKEAAEDQVEVLVLSRNYHVMHPYAYIDSETVPAGLPREGGFESLAWGKAGRFMTATAELTGSAADVLGWKIVVRQPEARALAPAFRLRDTLILVGVVSTVIYMLIAYVVSCRFSRPLEQLEVFARRVQAGEGVLPWSLPSSTTEVASLAGSLQAMTAALLSQRKALEEANATLERRVEERTADLQAERQLSVAVMQTSSNPVMLYRADGQCVQANAAAGALVGASVETLLGQNFHDIGSWKESGLFQAAQAALNGHSSELSIRAVSSFGQRVDCLMSVLPLQHGDENMVLLVGKDVSTLMHTQRELEAEVALQTSKLEDANRTLEHTVEARTAELQAANAELAQLARRDALTGLANRMAVLERQAVEFRRFARTHRPYAVLVVDIDHFKQVNDTFGHEVGDIALQHVATRLSVSVRVTDFVARLGGEEFLVLLPETDAEMAVLVAEKLRSAVADVPAPVVGALTVSIGVSQVQLEDSDEAEAVRRADAALYRAKQSGRNRVVSDSKA